MDNIEKGQLAEKAVLKYLLDKGFVFLAKNWRFGHQEIDVIMKCNNIIVFVEVKMRSTAFFGAPENAVGKMKQQFVAKAAEAFLYQNNHVGESRFDICSVVLKNNKFLIEHFEDAFWPKYF